MQSMSPLKMLVFGLTVIGLATTSFLPDRQTANVITATGKAGSSLFGTVISGKKS